MVTSDNLVQDTVAVIGAYVADTVTLLSGMMNLLLETETGLLFESATDRVSNSYPAEGVMVSVISVPFVAVAALAVTVPLEVSLIVMLYSVSTIADPPM